MYTLAVGQFVSRGGTGKDGTPYNSTQFQPVFPSVSPAHYMPRGFVAPASGMYLVACKVSQSGKYTNFEPLSVTPILLNDVDSTLKKLFPLAK